MAEDEAGRYLVDPNVDFIAYEGLVEQFLGRAGPLRMAEDEAGRELVAPDDERHEEQPPPNEQIIEGVEPIRMDDEDEEEPPRGGNHPGHRAERVLFLRPMILRFDEDEEGRDLVVPDDEREDERHEERPNEQIIEGVEPIRMADEEEEEPLHGVNDPGHIAEPVLFRRFPLPRFVPQLHERDEIGEIFRLMDGDPNRRVLRFREDDGSDNEDRDPQVINQGVRIAERDRRLIRFRFDDGSDNEDRDPQDEVINQGVRIAERDRRLIRFRPDDDSDNEDRDPQDEAINQGVRGGADEGDDDEGMPWFDLEMRVQRLERDRDMSEEVSDEMVKEADELREEDQSNPSATRYSRCCPICAIDNPRKRAVYSKCGHIICFPCAVSIASIAESAGNCPCCRSSTGFVKLFEAEEEKRDE